MKTLSIQLAIIIALTFAAVSYAGKLLVVSESSVLTGITLVNKDGVEIGFCVATDTEVFECDISISGIPSYIYDGGETDPPDPIWKATKENAFDSCGTVNCHAGKDDDKFEFDEWNDDGKGEENHKKHLKSSCLACHEKL